MNTKVLIDNIVRQTTVLIAQLSTAAGVRAPLAHVADQVFLSLAREIEAQGIGRKVVADMFGMALRGYQKKTQRLAESHSQQGKTLLEGILDYLEQHGSASRSALLERFRYDGERETLGVLNDLVNSGLVYAAGRGRSMLYGVTTDAERQRLTRESDAEVLVEMLWGAIYRSPGSTHEQLAAQFQLPEEQLAPALQQLLADARVQRNDLGELLAKGFQVPVGAESGWESAVFDHFQAVATAIVNKLHLLTQAQPHADWVGGTTLRFELSAGHPYKQRVLALLQETRSRLNELWAQVSDYNDAHGVPAERLNVVFYFGQNLDRLDLAEETQLGVKQ